MSPKSVSGKNNSYLIYFNTNISNCKQFLTARQAPEANRASGGSFSLLAVADFGTVHKLYGNVKGFSVAPDGEVYRVAYLKLGFYGRNI